MNFFSLEETQVETPVKNIVAQCGKCGLRSGCRTPCMQPTGTGAKRVLIVAEAPGEQEDNCGTQLVGKAGQRLRKTLNTIDVDLDADCRKINAVNCRPPNNKAPTDGQIANCRPLIWQEIEQFQPSVIIPLGGTALKSIIGHRAPNKMKISNWRGLQIPDVDKGGTGAWVCPAYHPSYVMRLDHSPLAEVTELLFRQDLEQAFGKRHDNLPAPVDTTIQNETAKTLGKRLFEHVQYANEVELAFDYETTTLKPDGPHAELLCVGFCADAHYDTGWVRIPPFCLDLTDEENVELASAILSVPPPGAKKIAANLQFEKNWTAEKLGIDIQDWHWDCCASAHVLDNRPGNAGVKFQSFVRLGVPDYEKNIDPYKKSEADNGHSPNRLKELSKCDLHNYCATDALVELELAHAQKEAFNEFR